jgi:hypothetical protein
MKILAVFLLLSLSCCADINAGVAGFEASAINDAAGALKNAHTANVAAAEGAARVLCGLTFDGVAGANSPALTRAVIGLCPIGGVALLKMENGVVTMQTTSSP